MRKIEKEARPYQGEPVTVKLPSFSMGEGWTSAGGRDTNESSLMRAPQLWEKLSHQNLGTGVRWKKFHVQT